MCGLFADDRCQTKIRRHVNIASVLFLLSMLPALSGFMLLCGSNQRRYGRISQMVVSASSGPAAATTKPATESNTHLLSKVQHAMALSNLSNQNITAAFEACSLWNDILQRDKETLLPRNIRALCHALYATSLVRCGSDETAIKSFDAVLSMEECINDETQKSMILGKASSLQRLLRYEEALQQFQSVVNSSSSSSSSGSSKTDGLLGAVTCAMRLGRLKGAQALVEADYKYPYSSIQENEEIQVMRAILCFLSSPVFHEAPVTSSKYLDQLLEQTSSSTEPSFLGQWVASVRALQRQDREQVKAPLSRRYQDLLDINIGAFDDPLLIHLDDKVLLHQTLVQHQSMPSSYTNETVVPTNRFWPGGFILPDEREQLALSSHQNADSTCNSDRVNASTNKDESTLWMLKRRAGYGSHGNQVMDINQALSLFQGQDVTMKEKTQQVLLQQIVHPPLLLQDGCKFSLRIYVIYFIPQQQDTQSPLPPSPSQSLPEIYISSRGLVKIASIPFQSRSVAESNSDDEDDDLARRMYMTNSGRERGMRQKELDFLKPVLEERGLSFKDFWGDIKDAVQSTMSAYHSQVISIAMKDGNTCTNVDEDSTNDDCNRVVLRQRLARLGIPKVLGFDFVVDDKAHPWLVEVNRFPGLEPRDEQDQSVKEAVLGDAWSLAAQRMGMTYDNHRDIEDDIVSSTKRSGSFSIEASSLERIPM